ncbi:Pimeloyl-ACP methyl ester carboxylesterase [Spirosomataceae bacterium TFI 002]|nr:Pimeloyl-ACP methyl ester carboxylesterase [Spirosomataceae bacterium TFI 002]
MKTIIVCLCFVIIGSSSFAQSFQSFDGTKIAYSDEGKGEAVLLVHGFINSSKNWNNTKLKQDLLKSGFRVIAPSLRGNGDSDKPQNEAAYANNAEIKDLMLLMDHLNLKTYKALGYSRGSIVLAKLLTKDKRIGRAVLGGMGKDFTNPDWDRRIMFMHAFLGTQPLNSQTEGAVNYAKTQNADLRALGLSQKYQPVTSPKELSKIKTPVLVIAGDQDKDNGDPAELKALLKKGVLKTVPGVHNSTHTSQAFSDEVLAFLAL